MRSDTTKVEPKEEDLLTSCWVGGGGWRGWGGGVWGTVERVGLWEEREAGCGRGEIGWV